MGIHNTDMRLMPFISSPRLAALARGDRAIMLAQDERPYIFSDQKKSFFLYGQVKYSLR